MIVLKYTSHFRKKLAEYELAVSCSLRRACRSSMNAPAVHISFLGEKKRKVMIKVLSG